MGVPTPWLLMIGLPIGMSRLGSSWFKNLVPCTLRLAVVIPSWLIVW